MTKNHLYDKVQASQSFHALDPVFSLTRPAAVPTAHDSPPHVPHLSTPVWVWHSLASPLPNQSFLSLVHSSYPSRQPKGYFIREGFCSVVSPGSSTSPQPNKTGFLPACFPAVAYTEGNRFPHFLSLTFPAQEVKACLCLSSLYPQHWVHSRNSIESAC